MTEKTTSYAKQPDAIARIHELEAQLKMAKSEFPEDVCISTLWDRLEALHAVADDRAARPVAVAVEAPKVVAPAAVAKVTPPPVAQPKTDRFTVGNTKLTGLALAMAANAKSKEAK